MREAESESERTTRFSGRRAGYSARCVTVPRVNERKRVNAPVSIGAACARAGTIAFVFVNWQVCVHAHSYVSVYIYV